MIKAPSKIIRFRLKMYLFRCVKACLPHLNTEHFHPKRIDLKTLLKVTHRVDGRKRIEMKKMTSYVPRGS